MFYSLSFSGYLAGDILCSSGGITIKAHFEGAALHRCQWGERQQLKLYLKPENIPINNSPWYAFQVDSRVTTRVDLELFVESGAPRYRPKISRNRVDWKPLIFSIDKLNNSMRFSIDVTEGSAWVAGQELITATNYQAWAETLVAQYGLNLNKASKPTVDA